MKKILLVLFLILSGCSKSVTPQKKEDENKVLTSYQLELIYEYDRHHDNYEEFVLYVDEDSVYYYIEDLNQITEKIMKHNYKTNEDVIIYDCKELNYTIDWLTVLNDDIYVVLLDHSTNNTIIGMIKDSLIILEQGNFITTKLWNIGTGIYYVTEDDSLNNELKYINDKQVNTIEKINYAMYRSIYTGGQVYHNNFIYAFDKTIYYCEKDQVTKYDFDYVVANANRVHDMLIITELYQDNEGNAKQRLHLYDLKSNQEIRTIDTFFASQFTDEKENIMYINFSNRYLQVMHFDENTNEDIKQLNEFNASSLWIPINEPYFAECIDYEHYNIYKIVS